LTGQRRRKRRRGWKKSLSAMLTHTRNGGRSIDHRASTFFFRAPLPIDSQLFDGRYFSSSYLVIWTNLKKREKKNPKRSSGKRVGDSRDCFNPKYAEINSLKKN
jgi:hypothetical protein